MKEVKPIKITIPGEEGDVTYTLAFSRDTVSDAEQDGFDADAVDTMPMTMIPKMFFHAFQMNHPEISREETDRILFEELGGLSKEMLSRLGELYSASVNTLINKAGNKAKNSKVKVVL